MASTPMEVEFAGTEEEELLSLCSSEFLVSYRWEYILYSVGLLIFGLFLTLSGYRAFRFCMWFSGALFATCGVLGICNRVDDLPKGANWGAALAVGSLAGCVTHLLPGIGAFLWGVYSGSLIAAIFIAVIVACGVFAPSPVATAALCILVGGNFCGALILLKHWSKPGLVFSTAVCGALLVTVGVDYFIEEWRLFNYCWYELLNLSPVRLRVPIPCWFSYCILGLWPVFTALGIFTQRMATARKYKQKVERVHVPQSAVHVYDTIRRTMNRQRGQPGGNADRYAVECNAQRNGQRQSRAHAQGARPGPGGEIPSRASRNRDRARNQRQSRQSQQQRPTSNDNAHNSRNAHADSDRQRLLQRGNDPASPVLDNRFTQPLNRENPNEELPPSYDDIFKKEIRRKSRK